MEVEENQIKATFRLYAENGPFVGGYKVGSLTRKRPILLFNLDFAASLLINSENKRAEFFDTILQTLMHEFGHAMQEWLDLQFDEYQVEKILGHFNERWNVFNKEQQAEEEGIGSEVFKIVDLIKWVQQSQANTVEEFKEEIKQLFLPVILWLEAEEKAKAEKEVAA